MRLLFGIILGILLTIGGAYVYDSSHSALDVAEAPGSPAAQRPMVNWDVVSVKWQHLTDSAHAEWTKLANRTDNSRTDSSRAN